MYLLLFDHNDDGGGGGDIVDENDDGDGDNDDNASGCGRGDNMVVAINKWWHKIEYATFACPCTTVRLR
jgi:hypothetical protein